MTSPSDKQGDIASRVNEALEHSVQQLPDNTLNDLYAIRRQALNGRAQQHKVPRYRQWLAQPLLKVMAPVACAVLIGLSLHYGSVEPVPELPVALLTEDVPTEDLSLLEDLEFVTWLAENEAEALL